MMPNKAPEPTAVGVVNSAVAVDAASRRWLGFLDEGARSGRSHCSVRGCALRGQINGIGPAHHGLSRKNL